MTRNPRTARALAAWFRHEWAASLPWQLNTHKFVADGLATTGGLTRELVSEWPLRGIGARPFTGWDAEGEPLNTDEDGHTTNRFRYWLEWMLLRSPSPTERAQAERLIRWAFRGFDPYATGQAESPPVAAEFMEAYLERALRALYRYCQREPVRFTICPSCRRNRCVCGEKSEAQHHAEEEGIDMGDTIRPSTNTSGTAGYNSAVVSVRV